MFKVEKVPIMHGFYNWWLATIAKWIVWMSWYYVTCFKVVKTTASYMVNLRKRG